MKTLSCFLAVAAFAAMSAQAENLHAVQIGSRIDVSVGGQFFTCYRFEDNEKYPFFFPVNGPSGASVTSMRNGEYPHHSSLFFGCDLVNGGNYWQGNLDHGRIISESVKLEKASGPEIVITQTCVWRRPNAPEPFRDTRRIVITAPTKEQRFIDFDVTMEALDDVVIKKTNHSLFSARVDPDLSVRNGGTLVNAEGAKGEKDTFGKGSPWMAFHGKRGTGASEGIAIFQHPGNPWYPSPWFTRDYGFFSPTPMFWPADNAETKVAKGEKLALRYRTMIFAGDPESAGVAAQFDAYGKAAK